MSRKLRIEYPGAEVGRQMVDGRMDGGERRNYIINFKWIAARLQMDTRTYVSNLVNEPPETQPHAQE
jgi:hypothetical protein